MRPFTLQKVYVSPNPKQPFSRAEDCEQFCYRDEDHFHGFSRALFTVIHPITQTLHYSNARPRFWPNCWF